MSSLPSAPETKGYQPLISVIVPIYNVEQYLDRCLASVCSQSYRNLQIICVDDGSTDGSPRIIAEWAAKDDRICVVTKENGGVSSARNAGLDAAKGEFVASVDSDDYLLPDIYEKAVARLTPDCDMLIFHAQMVDNAGRVVDMRGRVLKNQNSLYFPLPKEGFYGKEWLEEHLISPCLWDKFMRRAIIEEHHLRFAEGLVYEDDAFIRMFTPYVRRFYSFTEIGYMYVQRNGSIMHTKRSYLFKAEENLAIAELMYKHITGYDAPPLAWDNFMDSVARAVPLKNGAAPSKKMALHVRRMYADFIAQHHLDERFPGDFRLEYMTTAIYGWQKLFISRSHVHKTYKLFGVPMLKFEYKHGRRVAVRTFFSLFVPSVRKLFGK